MQTTEDVWQLYFDGASNQNGFGVGILIVAPDDTHIPLAFKLYFGVTNNEAEYEACIYWTTGRYRAKSRCDASNRRFSSGHLSIKRRLESQGLQNEAIP